MGRKKKRNIKKKLFLEKNLFAKEKSCSFNLPKTKLEGHLKRTLSGDQRKDKKEISLDIPPLNNLHIYSITGLQGETKLG